MTIRDILGLKFSFYQMAYGFKWIFDIWSGDL